MNRRTLLKHSALAAALCQLPVEAAEDGVPGLPERSLLQGNPERYWTKLREDQFFLPESRVFLNNGSLGIVPRPVMQRITAYLERAASLEMTEYPRWGYETLDEERTRVAAYVGCSKDELAFTHNCTEAMSMIANGLDLQAGDEVLTTDQEHGSGYNPWLLKAARTGITMRKIEIPIPPKSPEQLADLLISAIGPKTRVLMFSGITTVTGLVFPMREICEAARAKGVITVVDGAHVHGQIACRIDDLGCDFFAGSPHKWMFAPAGCGLLYVREEMQERFWPTIATGGWDDPKLKAGRYMRVGTNNRAIFEGMMAGIDFLEAIGAGMIYGRIHQLAAKTRRMAAERSYLEVLTPENDRMYGSLVTIRFKAEPEALKPLWDACDRNKVWVFHSPRLRLSSHVHTRPSDIEMFFDLADRTVGRKG